MGNNKIAATKKLNETYFCGIINTCSGLGSNKCPYFKFFTIKHFTQINCINSSRILSKIFDC